MYTNRVCKRDYQVFIDYIYLVFVLFEVVYKIYNGFYV